MTTIAMAIRIARHGRVNMTLRWTTGETFSPLVTRNTLYIRCFSRKFVYFSFRAVPSEYLRKLEIEMNDAFNQYREMYFEGGETKMMMKTRDFLDGQIWFLMKKMNLKAI